MDVWEKGKNILYLDFNRFTHFFSIKNTNKIEKNLKIQFSYGIISVLKNHSNVNSYIKQLKKRKKKYLEHKHFNSKYIDI